MVSQDLVEQFQRDGCVVARDFIPLDELAGVSEEANRVFGLRDLIDQRNIRCRCSNHYETGECRFDCFDPIIDLSSPIEQFVRQKRLADLVTALYGETACLFKDKLIYKPPGATGYALHQDYISWKSFPRSFVTMIIPLDASTDENGATEVFPGYHTQGCLSQEDGEYHELPQSAVDESRGVRLCLNQGDVAVFHGMLPHRSAPNKSTTWRRQLYLSFNAVSDGGEQRDAHYREFRGWLTRKYAEYGKTDTYYK